MKDLNSIKQSIEAGKNILIELSDVVDGEELVKAAAGSKEVLTEKGLAMLSHFMTPDGGIMAQGVKCFPKWAISMLDNPEKQYVLYLDYLDYSNMTDFAWLKSILGHVINGERIDNYVVVGHLLGDARNFDYEQVRNLFA